MTCNKFNAALKQLGYSQSGLARQLQISDRMVRHWAAGKWPVPAVYAALLNLMIDTKTKPEDLRI